MFDEQMIMSDIPAAIINDFRGTSKRSREVFDQANCVDNIENINNHANNHNQTTSAHFGERKRYRAHENNHLSTSTNSAPCSNNDDVANGSTMPKLDQHVVNKRISEMCSYYEDKIKSLTTHYEQAMQQSIQRFNEQALGHKEEVSQHEISHNSLIEENKILKKGILIQENKLQQQEANHRQISQNNEHLMKCMREMEETNNQLKMALLTIAAGSSNTNGSHGNNDQFMPPPPPDVY